MSGHLQAVIAAQRPATPRVVPRPRSRFESAGPSLGDGVPEPDEVTTVAAARPSPALAATWERAPVQTQRGSRPPLGVVADTQVRRPDHHATPRRPEEPSPPGRLRPATAATPPATDPAPRAGVESGRPAALPATAPEPSRPESPEAAPRRAPRSTPESRPPGAKSRAASEEPPPTPDVHRPSALPTGLLLAPRLPTVPGPEVGGVGSNSEPAERRRSPEPDVQVTIGRLEVRGSAPTPSAPERESRASRVLTLEEYAAQRGRAR